MKLRFGDGVVHYLRFTQQPLGYSSIKLELSLPRNSCLRLKSWGRQPSVDLRFTQQPLGPLLTLKYFGD